MRKVRGSAIAGLAACGLVAVAVVGTSAPAIAGWNTRAGHCVTASGSGATITLSQSVVEAGAVCFTVSTVNPGIPGGMGGSSVQMFQLNDGATLPQVMSDFVDEFAPTLPVEAKGTQELTRDITFYGLADVTPGHPETVVENLRPGTYYVWDDWTTLAFGKPPTVATLTVIGSGDRHRLHAPLHVTATTADRLTAPATWPHQGTYVFRNAGDSYHLMDIVPLAPTTTDEQLQALFDAHNTEPPVFLNSSLFGPGPSGGNDAVAPGNAIQVTYNLPPGNYVIICYVPDSMTGMPHGYMGMHQVITLR